MDETLSLSIDASAIPAQLTGVGRYVDSLVAALGRRDDVAVSVITRSGDRERWEAASPGARVHDVAPARRPLRLAWEQALLPRLLARIGPDVHHGTHYTMPRLARLPKVVTVHDMTLVLHPEWHEPTKAIFFRNSIKAALRSARVIICVSQNTADQLLEFGRPAGEVRVAPHGVDLDRFSARPGPADDEALSRLGVSAPYLAFVGTVEPRKGVPLLISAFEAVAASRPDLRLVIAGKAGWGDAGAQVDQAIRISPVGSRITRLGFVDDDDVAPLLRGARAVVYPSLEEGFGLPVLEAMACGAPTITTTGSAMEEFATGAAYLVTPGRVDELADAIGLVVDGDPAGGNRRAAGLEAAAGRSWDDCAERHMAAYRLAAGWS